MDEELSTRLTGYLDVVEKAVESGSVFVVEQAPAVVQELILYERVYTTVSVMLAVASLLCGIFAVTRLRRLMEVVKNDDSGPNAFRFVVLVVVAWACILVGCVQLNKQVPRCIKSWCAPRLVVLEKTSEILK